MIKSFLGADSVDEWRPRSLVCAWGDSSSDSSSDSSTTGGASEMSPGGPSEMSPGESLFGTGGFYPDSGFVNFNEGQSYPGYYDTSSGVANFNEGNPWGGTLSDISNTLTGGFAGGPAGWAGEMGAYGNMLAGPSIGYANNAGNVTAPGLVGGFMDPGPFGMFGNQPGAYGPPGVFDAPPDARDPGQEMDQGGRTYFDPTMGGTMNPNGADPSWAGPGAGVYNIEGRSPGIDPYVGTQHPDAMNIDPNVPVSPANPLAPVAPETQAPTTNPFSISPGNFFAPGPAEAAQTVGHPSLTPAYQFLADQMNNNYYPMSQLNDPATMLSFELGQQGREGGFNNFATVHDAARGMEEAQMANNPGLDVGLGQYAAGLANQGPQGLLNQASNIDPASLQATLPTVANMPWGQTAAGPYQGPFAGPDVVGNRQEAITLQEARGGIDPQQIQDAWNEAAGHRGESERSADIRGYDPAREALNEQGRAQLADLFDTQWGRETLQEQRDLQDTQRAPWEARTVDMPLTPWAYPMADPRSIETRGPQNIEYEYGNQNMGRPNSYPTLAEFLGPGRGQSQNIYAPERATSPLQVTVPGRVSESSRGASTPFGGQQQGGRGVQGQMDALLAQARTAPTQAARIAALDALNGLISATYGRGPNQSVGRGPYGGDPDPFIAQMLRMGR